MAILVSFAVLTYCMVFSKNASKMFNFCLFLLFLITAMRHPALGGTDNIVYFATFESIPKIDDLSSYESRFQSGYLFFNSIVKTIFGKYIYFQIIYTIICFYLLKKTIELLELPGRYKCLLLFSYFCYGFLWYFWGTYRQNLANLIFYCLITCYFCNKEFFSGKKKMLILLSSIIIPYLFHSSAVVNICFVPFLLFSRDIVNVKKRMLWVLLSSVVIFISTKSLFGIIQSYAVFIDDEYADYSADAQSANLINYILKIGFFVVYCLNYDRERWSYKKYVLDLFSIFILLSSINLGFFGRVSEYYALGLYVAMAFSTKYYDKRFYNIPRLIFLLMFLMIFIRHLMFSDDGFLTKYYFLWEKPDSPFINNLFWQNFY